MKRLRAAALAIVLMVYLATTALAAVYMGLDEAFMKFLNPVNHEQTDYLSNGAHMIGKQIRNENGTLEIKEVIGDSNLAYILMDFSAPEGIVLDAARTSGRSVPRHFYNGQPSFLIKESQLKTES